MCKSCAVLRNVADAEDIVQDVFLKLYRKEAWKEAQDEKAYLARVTWRLCMDRQSATRFKARGERERTWPSNDPEVAAIENQRHECIHRPIDALPEKLRRPLVLSAIEEMTTARIAAAMDLPEGTIRRRNSGSQSAAEGQNVTYGWHPTMNEQKDDLDPILDAALASYTGGREPIGLQTRILSRLDERRKPPRSFLYPVAAIFLLALLLCYMLLTERPTARVAQRRPPPPAAASNTAAKTQPTAIASIIRHPRRRRYREPKLAQFAGLAPMTNEERTLLKFLAGHPTEVPSELTNLGGPIQPIEIAAITLKPLE